MFTRTHTLYYLIYIKNSPSHLLYILNNVTHKILVQNKIKNKEKLFLKNISRILIQMEYTTYPRRTTMYFSCPDMVGLANSCGACIFANLCLTDLDRSLAFILDLMRFTIYGETIE